MTPKSLVFSPTSLSIIFKCPTAYGHLHLDVQYPNSVLSFPNPRFLRGNLRLVCYFTHRPTLTLFYFHLPSVSANSLKSVTLFLLLPPVSYLQFSTVREFTISPKPISLDSTIPPSKLLASGISLPFLCSKSFKRSRLFAKEGCYWYKPQVLWV